MLRTKSHLAHEANKYDTSFLSIKRSFSLWIKEFLDLWPKVVIHCTSKRYNIIILGWLYRSHCISYDKST